MKMMVYHGTDCLFNQIDLSKSCVHFIRRYTVE